MKKETKVPDSKVEYVDLFPSTPAPRTLLCGDHPPLCGGRIEDRPLNRVLHQIKRKEWFNGIRIKSTERDKIRVTRLSTFTYDDHCKWADEVADNTAICKISPELGIGVYVVPGKTLKKGTFIPYTGVLDFTKTGITTNFHAAAYQNPDSTKIDAVLDPTVSGGICDLPNHAFNKDDLANIEFIDPSFKARVALPNLQPCTKYYNGIQIVGLEVVKDIPGGQ